MKVFCIADRPPQQSISQTLKENPDVCAVFTLGDLDYFMLRELENVHLPKFGVYGNHCSKTYFPDLGIENLHGKIVEFQGKTMLGIEGCERYKDDPHAALYTQEEMFEIMKDFPRVDIVITHAPPFGVHDDPNETAHRGWKALREYVEKYQPDYVLHGHTYPSKGEVVVDMIGATKVIYVYQDKIIDLFD